MPAFALDLSELAGPHVAALAALAAAGLHAVLNLLGPA